MFEFLWDGKIDKINRKTVIQNCRKGGIGMIDIDLFINSIKCSWVKRILDKQNKGDWKQIYNHLAVNYYLNVIFVKKM